ncbi:hypothetical protein LCGC14_0262380 [marine sediment metagenome]|uniref:Uncharacterized protein n=1 Tax=marine sediment metagenome TaxID=412755 RepID=A0A0F9U5T6_9ZZZZ
MTKKQRAGLNITLEAKLELDSVKSHGQSYGGIIQELVKFYKERSKDYWPRRREQREKSKK